MAKTTRTMVTGALFALLLLHGSVTGQVVPPGPPGSEATRMPKLSEIEPRTLISEIPYVITNSGAYALVGDLNVTNAENGITIEANNVTVNLNGFTLDGMTTNSYCGIYISNAVSSIRIVNGTLRNWGAVGVYAPTTDSAVYEDLAVVSNGWGINGMGLYVGTKSQVKNCIATANMSMGIGAADSSIIENCTANGNGGAGISVSDGATIVGCSSFENANWGITAISGSTVVRCSVYTNASDGILVADGSSIEGCTAYRNVGNGIRAGGGVSVTDCLASRNGENGIRAGGGCSVRRCNSWRNVSNGIWVTHSSFVADNVVNSAGYGDGNGAGIYVTEYGNRIENNHVSRSDRGFDVDGTNNIIVRNTAEGNTAEYEIANDNNTGPIQTNTVGTGAWDNFVL